MKKKSNPTTGKLEKLDQADPDQTIEFDSTELRFDTEETIEIGVERLQEATEALERAAERKASRSEKD